MLMGLTEKADNMQGHVGNISGKRETLRKGQKKSLKSKP